MHVSHGFLQVGDLGLSVAGVADMRSSYLRMLGSSVVGQLLELEEDRLSSSTAGLGWANFQSRPRAGSGQKTRHSGMSEEQAGGHGAGPSPAGTLDSSLTL